MCVCRAALAEVYDNLIAQKYNSTEEFMEMEVIGRSTRNSNRSEPETSSTYDDQEPTNALRVIGMRKSDEEPLGMTVRLEGGKVGLI